MTFSSTQYWEERYQQGGNSGNGSYGYLAEYKAEILNEMVKVFEIKTVLDVGCGDGNQASFFDFPCYIGVDVSLTAIEMCKKRFQGDPTKVFYQIPPVSHHFINDVCLETPPQMALSLDVIYHLVEDDVFDEHMQFLFQTPSEYVIVYSSNFDQDKHPEIPFAPHIRHRIFTDWIKANTNDWALVEVLINPHPYQLDKSGSLAHFHIFKKK